MSDKDTIYRQAAIDALKGLEFCHYMEFGEYIGEDTREVRLIRAEKAQDALQNLPPVQPLTAYVISDEDGNIKCSNCGSFECWGNYCMNCGAKMRGKNNG